MKYITTRTPGHEKTASLAILQGLAADGGLMVPQKLPKLPKKFWDKLSTMSYADRAAMVMRLFLSDFSDDDVAALCKNAYGSNFDDKAVAKCVAVGDDTILELWHGPTSAFKDMALQCLPHLLANAMKIQGEERTMCILAATSGDTGKAALEGFKNAPQSKVLVFYPRGGVSPIQELQMITQEGNNVNVCAINGNFDDAQSGVKALFNDPKLHGFLAAKDHFFSSANSINWGRVLPQIVYYVSAYTDMVALGRVKAGKSINICVPTGNFGNILAAYYAKCMGAPIGKLLCASNKNDVLTEFINSGTYDRNREFHMTSSPSMDIIISSNLERALFALSGGDCAAVSQWMAQLSSDGSYTVNAKLKKQLEKHFYAAACDEAATKQTIAQVWSNTQYLLDPHTAVGYDVARRYKNETGDTNPMLIVSTASPFKFADTVLDALGQSASDTPEASLSALTGWQTPVEIAALATKPVRFNECVDICDMNGAVERFVG